MDIQLEKTELINMLKETENPSIINAIKEIFRREKKDWWDDLSDEQKFEIEESDKEIDEGLFFTYEDVMSKLRK